MSRPPTAALAALAVSDPISQHPSWQMTCHTRLATPRHSALSTSQHHSIIFPSLMTPTSNGWPLTSHGLGATCVRQRSVDHVRGRAVSPADWAVVGRGPVCCPGRPGGRRSLRVCGSYTQPHAGPARHDIDWLGPVFPQLWHHIRLCAPSLPLPGCGAGACGDCPALLSPNKPPSRPPAHARPTPVCGTHPSPCARGPPAVFT